MWMILGHNRLLSGRRRILCILILCVFFLCLKSLWDSFESGQGGEGRGGEERRIDGAIVSIQKAQCFPFNWNPIHEFKVENVLAGPNQKALIGRCRVSMMLVACFNCICSLMATSQTAKPINRSLELFSRFSSGFIYFFSFHSLCLSSFILFGFSIYFISFCLFFFFSFLFLFFEELISLLGSAAADMNRRRMCIWLVTKWRRVAIFVDSTPSAAVQVKRGGEWPARIWALKTKQKQCFSPFRNSRHIGRVGGRWQQSPGFVSDSMADDGATLSFPFHFLFCLDGTWRGRHIHSRASSIMASIWEESAMDERMSKNGGLWDRLALRAPCPY